MQRFCFTNHGAPFSGLLGRKATDEVIPLLIAQNPSPGAKRTKLMLAPESRKAPMQSKTSKFQRRPAVL